MEILSEKKHSQVEMIEFITDWLSDIAGRNVDDTLREKIRSRVSLLSNDSEIRLYNIVNDFKLSNDKELQKIAKSIAPFLKKGNYERIFMTQDRDLKTQGEDNSFQP
ncbi:hypothetical protein QHC70_003614 [Citrobacter freundii]|nr:hypothetical protein [Citrobacter freundii]ELQ7945266.1 hypothetical protein [Citrobacter freundii]ELQ7995393.1 hypothetical protein [Citrobacter freundii]